MLEYIIHQLTVVAIDEDSNPICDSNNQPIEYDVNDFDCSSLCDDLNSSIELGEAYVTPINPSN